MRSNRIVPNYNFKIKKFMKQLHLVMCILLLISSILVVLSTNPVESVLYLILTFCNAGITLFLFNLEFFGLIFIIIYVGAIAVLFLFVVMMLNIKEYTVPKVAYFTKSSSFLIKFVFGLYFYILMTQIYLYLYISMPYAWFDNFEFDTVFTSPIDSLTTVEVFGQVLYNHFSVYVPLAGLILLIALIGSIVLTLNFNNQKPSIVDYKQLARSDNFLALFFKKK